jgi:hypothetical protein
MVILATVPFFSYNNKMYKYMKIVSKKFINTKKGVTLMEIMTALLILAFAFLPIIGVIGTSTKDTDVANSVVFAQTTARNILDTLLDDVPFNSIIITDKSKNYIARIEGYNGYDPDSFLDMIGAKDAEATGEVFDERGIKYDVTIYAFPISAHQGKEHDVTNELLFSYMPRPQYEGDTSEKNDKWYTYSEGGIYRQNDSPDPYTIEVATTTKNAYELGARQNNNSSEYYIMKKIVFQMTWTSRDGHDRRLELYTMKANLDSDGKQ